jgi:cyanophycinase
MRDLYRRGGVIAGTSAGAAVMSKVMYRSANSVLDTLLSGVEMGKELGPGLGLLDEKWFVEQHCLVRGRFARSLVAMHSEGIKYGIGVDENSAVVVRNGKDVRVLGYKGALVMDLSDAKRDAAVDKFNLSNVRLTYLDRGDKFDLLTMEVTPSQQKLDDEYIDPNSPEFRPSHRRRLFFNDILGNMAVADLMGELIDSTQQEAIGLAFDGARARFEAVDGFEFKFSRDERSRGWYTEAFGGDDYTVENIRLDIQPIRLTGPLYQNLPAPPLREASLKVE